uniref:Nucleoside phosphorylase domain-containing protein n=1 Tax=Aureoumbra lagunensis TaxID=44058 RepID=A0A7S3K341_9STRA|mmetsp:Transcript_21972/g.28462  ORF Transcript_21972/g.28462 Transcript_21972/m.28462 type:complete len:285 (+) Transcript_21972:39-893(+)
MSEKNYYSDTNGVPKDSNGRVTHVGVGLGDLANRILTVGSLSRAESLSSFLEDVQIIRSSRGFTSFSGKFQTVPVSIIATGMGSAMMDFLVREARAVINGPMAIVRLGTCGGIGIKPGVIVANTPGSYAITRQPDAWMTTESSSGSPYKSSRIALPNKLLAELVFSKLASSPNQITVIEGLNASTDSFYSSQGRLDPCFDDRNENWSSEFLRQDTISVEMESFHLLHLANCAKPSAPIAAATTAIVCADRTSGNVILAADLPLLERSAGSAILQALVEFNLNSV